MPTSFSAELSNDLFLDGRMSLDSALAARVVRERIGEPLGLSLEQAAEGILQIANANMVKAIGLVTVERGFDPREFSLVAFGGAGPLHAVDLARQLQLPEVIVPLFPGVTSALGLLFVDPLEDFSWAYVKRQDEIDLGDIRRHYGEMEERVVGSLARQGVERSLIGVERSLDLRYIGQLHSITVSIDELSEEGLARSAAAFHDEHLRQYRYSHPEHPVEISTLRVAARGVREKPDLSLLQGAKHDRAPAPERRRPVHFDGHGWVETRVLDRLSLSSGDTVDGPCVVEELDSTVVLPPTVSGTVDGVGNLVITVG